MVTPTNHKRTFSCYFPLWGVGFDSDECGLVGGSVLVCKPYEEEWRTILKTDVFNEFVKYHQNNILAIEPQTCLCIVYPLSDDQDFTDEADKHQDDMNNQISDAILTLRLLKQGWFHDPRFIESAYITSDDFPLILRDRGPYRQLFMAGLNDNFPSFYQLSINELTRHVNETSPATEIWNLIHTHRQSGGNRAVDVAIENFNNAYSLIGNVTYEQKVSFLFTALDSMLGGMSLRQKGQQLMLHRTEMKVKFKERVRELLKCINFDNAETEAGWIDALRNLRNPIAHGTKESLEKVAEENFERLLSAIRIILRHYISFSTSWNTNRHQIAETLGLEDDKSLVEAYNKALELSSLGNSNARTFL